MHRRCNYDATTTKEVEAILQAELANRAQGETKATTDYETKLGYYIQQWERSTVADVVILPYINHSNVCELPAALIDKLLLIIADMLKYKPFEIITIHDEFKCHPNNVNHMRWAYKEILADLADSNLLDDLLSQVYGVKGTFDKLTNDLGDKIRKANYALT